MKDFRLILLKKQNIEVLISYYFRHLFTEQFVLIRFSKTIFHIIVK